MRTYKRYNVMDEIDKLNSAWDTDSDIPDLFGKDAWTLEPIPVEFPYLPGRPFYNLQAYYQQVASRTKPFPTVNINVETRESSTDPDITIRVVNMSSLVRSSFKYLERIVSKSIDIASNERSLVAAEGMIVNVGLPVMEYINEIYAGSVDYENEHAQQNDTEGMLAVRKAAPYKLQHQFAIGEGANRQGSITLRTKNDKRRLSVIADEMGWSVSLTIQLCVIAAMALGDGVLSTSMVEMGEKELHHLVRTLDGDFDPPKRRRKHAKP